MYHMALLGLPKYKLPSYVELVWFFLHHISFKLLGNNSHWSAWTVVFIIDLGQRHQVLCFSSSFLSSTVKRLVISELLEPYEQCTFSCFSLYQIGIYHVDAFEKKMRKLMFVAYYKVKLGSSAICSPLKLTHKWPTHSAVSPSSLYVIFGFLLL